MKLPDPADYDVKVAYEEGFATGVKWDCPWVPGGPFIHPPRGYSFDNTSDSWHILTKAYNNAWIKGWCDAGGEEKIEAAKQLPRWKERYEKTGRYY